MFNKPRLQWPEKIQSKPELDQKIENTENDEKQVIAHDAPRPLNI